MNYFTRLKYALIVSDIFALVSVIVFYMASSEISVLMLILILIYVAGTIFVYNNSKSLDTKFFDYDFNDLINKLGLDYDMEQFISVSSCGGILNHIYKPNLYFYKNAMIVQIDNKAMYLKQLSNIKISTVFTGIKFNYKGTEFFASTYRIPENIKNIIQKTL